MQNDIHMLEQEIKNELFDQETEEPIEPENGIDDSRDYDDDVDKQDAPEENFEDDTSDESNSYECNGNADGQDTSEENSEDGDTSDESNSCERDGNADGQEKSEEPTKPKGGNHTFGL